MASSPSNFISAVKHSERSTLATRSSTLRPMPMLNGISTQKRNLHTNPEGTENGLEASKKENRSVYRNRHGEEIVFSPYRPPRGFVFVPSGNAFITRSCRELAQKRYAVFRPKSRKKLAAQIGLHVPKDVFGKVDSDFKAKRARINQKLSRALDKKYPQIPPADKDKLHCFISSQCPNVTGNAAPNLSEINIYAYVRDRYTPFKPLNLYEINRDTKAIDRVHQRVREILASWRGED
ncbi:hypothetical protein MMC13_008173 [Lambiella insularis]|nr:hypothetical protein [Lambiella insularis]